MILGILSILGFGLAATFLTLLLLTAILVFEIVMFLNVIQNEHILSDRKLLWLAGMILFHPFVAIAYYFTDFRKPV